MKFCKDCHYFKGSVETEDQCLHSKNTRIDPVRGGIEYIFPIRTVRKVSLDFEICGPEGLWWKRK